MRSVYVLVNNDGTNQGGSGISSTSREGKGNYFVNYEKPFSQSPGVSATPWGTGVLCSVNVLAENTCEVLVTDLQGNLIDSGFAFLAVGD
ncbi:MULTISPECIES: hypothetical protein [Aquimarina]|uniref:hypothetical protein n=1 Tax=Aquimarina TaxID=290174 RepID=UPI000D6969A9|nr:MULTISPECIES: hypothetical protein [Aquimarina]